jgi:outer membrane protein assembly factor BamB
MLGRTPSRNAVSPEKNPPLTWDLATGTNVRWKSRTGTNTHTEPVVSDGLVWIGANNANSSQSRSNDVAVLLCFRERDGKLLYTYVSPRKGTRNEDWPDSPLGCSPFIEGDRLWFATNRNEVVCLDIGPLKHAGTEPQIEWKYDLGERLGVFTHGSLMGIPRYCSIAGYKHWIYVITSNGVDVAHLQIPAPNAPSLVCLEKDTGKVVWTDNSPGANLLHGQGASPLVAEIAGRVQVVAPQGDGWVRSFDATTGQLLWKFDMNRKSARWELGGRGKRNNVLATPVLFEDRIYIAAGQDWEHGDGAGRLCCLDATKSGDISSELAVDKNGNVLPVRRFQAIDPKKGEKTIPNPNHGLVWEFNADAERFEDQMHRSISAVAIAEGLVFATDITGLVHCLDVRTGQRYWHYDAFAQILGTPLIIDGKVYIGDQDGIVSIFRLSRDPAVAMVKTNQESRPIAVIAMPDSVYSSPIFANGTLYIATEKQLFALARS